MSLFPGMDLTKMDPPTLTLLGAACCVMLSMHFTVQLVSQHLFYWKNPKEQKAILIIVLMPPLYAITSFVGLLDIKGSKTFFTCLESVKECYEALVSPLGSTAFLHLKLVISLMFPSIFYFNCAGHCQVSGIDVQLLEYIYQ